MFLGGTFRAVTIVAFLFDLLEGEDEKASAQGTIC